MNVDHFYGTGGILSSYSGIDCTTIPVTEGEKFLITGCAWSNSQFYVLLDISGTVILGIPNTNIGTTINTYVDYELTIPPGGTLLFLNDIRLTGNYTRLSVKRSTAFQPNGIGVIDDRISVLENIIEDATLDPLFGKTILFDGDSICHGGSANDGLSGWAGRIGTKHSMTWKNYGIGGGTVTSGTYSYTTVVDTGTLDWITNTYYLKNPSPTTADDMYLVVTQGEWNGTSTLYTKGSARHWESTTVDTMYAEYPNADYIIFEACLNDGFNNIPIGSASSSYTNTFATNQYAPAFECMIKRARELFGNVKIGVIIPHRVAYSTISNYHEVARGICNKWGIDYIDLERESGLMPFIEPMKSTMYSDGATHLTTSGYDYITFPKVEDWLKSL